MGRSFTFVVLWGIVRALQGGRGLLVQVFAGAILANFVTVTILYNLWKLTKNERDLKAMAVLFVCAMIILAVGLAGSGQTS